jgi:hypothetical protein
LLACVTHVLTFPSRLVFLPLALYNAPRIGSSTPRWFARTAAQAAQPLPHSLTPSLPHQSIN